MLAVLSSAMSMAIQKASQSSSTTAAMAILNTRLTTEQLGRLSVLLATTAHCYSSADDLVRYKPDGKNGESSGINIGFRAWDGTEGAAGTKYDILGNGGPGVDNGFSTQTRSALQTVTSVNDAPVLDNTGDVFLNDPSRRRGRTCAVPSERWSPIWFRSMLALET